MNIDYTFSIHLLQNHDTFSSILSFGDPLDDPNSLQAELESLKQRDVGTSGVGTSGSLLGWHRSAGTSNGQHRLTNHGLWTVWLVKNSVDYAC